MTKNDEILIIHTSWYKDFINEMSDTALEILESTNYKIKVHKAPGSLEIPALAKAKISSKTLGILAIGIIIRGETSHYDYVCQESARALMEISLEGTAIGYGILTCETKEQAVKRSKPDGLNKGKAAALACINMVDVLTVLKND